MVGIRSFLFGFGPVFTGDLLVLGRVNIIQVVFLFPGPFGLDFFVPLLQWEWAGSNMYTQEFWKRYETSCRNSTMLEDEPSILGR